MRRLMGLLWVVTVVTGFYGTVRGVSEKAAETRKSFWRVFFSGQENFVWHSAPGWYYPVWITLTVVTVAVTAWYFFSRD